MSPQQWLFKWMLTILISTVPMGFNFHPWLNSTESGTVFLSSSSTNTWKCMPVYCMPCRC